MEEIEKHKYSSPNVQIDSSNSKIFDDQDLQDDNSPPVKSEEDGTGNSPSAENKRVEEEK